jgi:hypothetical protein
VAYLVLWAIVIGICLLINRLLGRPAVNPGRVGLVVFFVAMAIDLGVLTYFMANGPSLPPFKQGELFGQAVGKSLIPLALSVVLDIRFSKKHRRGIQAASGETPAPTQ